MKNLRKATSLLLVLMMLVSMVPAVFATSSFTDFPTGWSAEAMQAAVDNGLIQGKGNSKIEPQAMLTRAEAATIINRAFGATVKADISSYTDVSKSDWYYDEFAKAVNMDTIVGTGDGKINPEGNITREEIFAVMARALVLSGGSNSSLAQFSDASLVSNWAEAHVRALVANGYINGNADGTLNPKGNITREEFAQMMHNIFKTYISTSGTVTSVGADSVIIRTPGVTLKNVTIEKDLVLGDGVGDGDTVLENVTIKGRLLCRGGEGSVKLVKTTVGDKVVVYDVNGTVNFLNYEDEAPFKGKELHTPATFLKRKPTGGGSGGSSRPSVTQNRYKVVYYLQNDEGTYSAGYTTLDKYYDTNIGDVINYLTHTDYKTSFIYDGREYKYNAALSTPNLTVTGNSATDVIKLYYNKVYNYTFDLDGGSVSDTSKLNGTYTVEDDGIAMPETPIKEGFIFKGWKNTDGTDFNYVKGTTVGDITIKASWEAKSPDTTYYKVTVNYDSTKATMTSSVTDLNNIEEGTNVTITFAPKNGYERVELKDENGVIAGNVVTYNNISSNHTVTYTVKPIEYTYTFNLNGGNIGGNTANVTGTYTIETTTDFTPSNPVKENHEFVGWENVSDNSTFAFVAGMTGNVSVIAKWRYTGTVTPPVPEINAKLSFVPTYDESTGVVKVDVMLDKMPYDIEDIHSITVNYTFDNAKLAFNHGASNIGGTFDASATRISWYDADETKGLNSASFASGAVKLFTLYFDKKVGATGDVEFKFAATSLTDYDGTKSTKVDNVNGTVNLGTEAPTNAKLAFVPTYNDTTGEVTVKVTLDKMPYDIEDIHSITINYSFDNSKLTFVSGESNIGGNIAVSGTAISWYDVDETKGLDADDFTAGKVTLFTLKFAKKSGATGIANFKFVTTSVTDYDGTKSTKVDNVNGSVDLTGTTPSTFRVNFYNGSNGDADNYVGGLNVDANSTLTQSEVDGIIGSKDTWYAYEGYSDSYGDKHLIRPELWVNNGTDWVLFDITAPITSDIDVCLMYRKISLYVSDDVYLNGSYLPGVETLGFTIWYDSESSIAESALDAMSETRTLLKTAINALEQKGIYVYDELLEKLEAKGLIDTNRKILEQKVTLKMSDFLTVEKIEAEVNKYIEDNIDDDDFIATILGNESVVNSLLSNESFKKAFMEDVALRQKLVDNDEFIKSIANDDAMIDSIIASDSFKDSFISSDASLDYILSSDALKDYIKTNTEFRNFVVDAATQYVKDVYFNETVTDTAVKNYINDKILATGEGSIREELYNDPAVKAKVKTWLKDKLDANPNELLTNATFKAHVKQKVRDGLTKGDTAIKELARTEFKDYTKVGPKLEELLLTDASFRLSFKDDIKNTVKTNGTFKAEVKNDADLKASAKTKILDELKTDGSDIRNEALTDLKTNISSSEDAKNYAKTELKDKFKEEQFKNNTVKGIDVAKKEEIRDELKDTILNNAELTSKLKKKIFTLEEMMDKIARSVMNELYSGYGIPDETDLASDLMGAYYNNDNEEARKQAISDILSTYPTIPDGPALPGDVVNVIADKESEYFNANKETLYNDNFVDQFDNIVDILFADDDAFDKVYDEIFDKFYADVIEDNFVQVFDAVIDDYYEDNFNTLYDDYFDTYYGSYFDTAFEDYYTKLCVDDVKFKTFYNDYAAGYVEDNFNDLYDSHFDAFYDKLAADDDYKDVMDKYIDDNFETLYSDNIVQYYNDYCDEEQFNTYFDEYWAVKDNYNQYYTDNATTVVRELYLNPANTEIINIVNTKLNQYTQELVLDFANNTITDAGMQAAIESFMTGDVKTKIRDKYATDASFKANISALITDNAKDYIEKYVNGTGLTESERQMVKDAISDYADKIATEYVNGTISAENKNFVDNQIKKFVDEQIEKFIDGTDRDTIRTLIDNHADTAINAFKETKPYKDLMADFAAKKDDLTINKGNLVLIRAIASAVRGYSYDKIKAEFIPAKLHPIIEKIDEDIVRGYVLQATSDFANGLDAKCDIVENSSDENATETYPASLSATVDVVKDWLVPYYNKFVSLAADKIKSVPEVDYNNNEKLKKLVETNWLGRIIEPTGDVDGSYRIKPAGMLEYYDIAFDMAVLAHDALVYYNKLGDEAITEKTNAVASLIAAGANKVNEIVMTYITTGKLPKGYTLEDILDLNVTVKNLYNKYEDKVETALDKYEQYLNRDYDEVFNKLVNATISAEGGNFKATDIALEMKSNGVLFGIDSAFDAVLSGNNTVPNDEIQDKINKVVNKLKSAQYTPAFDASKVHVDAYKASVESKTFRGHETGNITIELNRYLQ